MIYCNHNVPGVGNGVGVDDVGIDESICVVFWKYFYKLAA